MGKLSNDLLLESYFKAKELKLNQEFIFILEYELIQRSLFDYKKPTKKGCV